MPTYWESSERPLFVKTVIVNGSRHAILSQVDPLCHLTSSARKTENFPTSCQTCTSASNFSCFEMKSSIREESRNMKYHPPIRRARSCYQSKRDVSSDLQNCLIKLQLVLSAQNKTKMKKELLCLEDEKKTENDNGKNVEKQWNTERMQKSKISIASFDMSFDEKKRKEIDIAGCRGLPTHYTTYDNEEQEYFCLDITKLSERCLSNSNSGIYEFREYDKENIVNYEKDMNRSNLIRKISPLTECTEKILKKYSNYFFPILCLENNIPWENVSNRNCFTNHFYNSLSDRVLQWLDLARRRKERLGEKLGNEISDNQEQLSQKKFLNFKKINRNMEIKKAKSWKRKYENDVNFQRPKDFSKEAFFQKTSKTLDEDEDVYDDIKQECDVKTALSTALHDYSKYSKDSNKFHEVKCSGDDQSFFMNIMGRFPKTSDETIMQDDSVSLSFRCNDGFRPKSSLLAIPKKLSSKSPFAEKLRKSILNSFETIVNIDPKTESYESNEIEKKAYESFDGIAIRNVRKNYLQTSVKYQSKLARKKGLLIKQKNFRFSRDNDGEYDDYLLNNNEYSPIHKDDEKSHHLSCKKSSKSMRDYLNEKKIISEKKCKCHGLMIKDCNENSEFSKENNHEIQITYNRTSLNAQMQKRNYYSKDSEISGKKVWTKEKAGTRPQLHIFMPGIDTRLLEIDTQDESASETESLTK